MKRAVIPCCALALALAGCATVQPLPARTVVDETGEERICSMERPTGSHQAREVCRTQAEIDREREKAEDLLHRGLQVGEIIIY